MKYLKKYPEYCFLAISLIFWASTLQLFNPIAIVVVLLSVLMVWSQNKSVANFISIVYGLMTFYFLLALLSEFSEFPQMDSSAWSLISVGSLIVLANVLIIYGLWTKYNAQEVANPSHQNVV
jgi:hypothetical protein